MLLCAARARCSAQVAGAERAVPLDCFAYPVQVTPWISVAVRCHLQEIDVVGRKPLLLANRVGQAERLHIALVRNRGTGCA